MPARRSFCRCGYSVSAGRLVTAAISATEHAPSSVTACAISDRTGDIMVNHAAGGTGVCGRLRAMPALYTIVNMYRFHNQHLTLHAPPTAPACRITP